MLPDLGTFCLSMQRHVASSNIIAFGVVSFGFAIFPAAFLANKFALLQPGLTKIKQTNKQTTARVTTKKKVCLVYLPKANVGGAALEHVC